MKDKLLIFTDSLAGRQYAAREGRTCHTDVLGFEEAYGSLCALRKTYSTHVEGLFPLKGGEVIITADAGEEKLSGMVAMAAATGFDIEVAENQNAAARPGRLLSEEPIIKTEDLAAAAHVSINTLERHFKEALGTSPANYLKNKRLANAARLLRVGKSVTDACFDGGFANCSHFISQFKSAFGVTPKKFQTKNK